METKTVGLKMLVKSVAANLNKSTELEEDLTKRTQAGVKEVLKELAEQVEINLIAGNSVRLDGIGTLKTRTLKARNGVNPKTGEKIQIQESRVVKFTPSSSLKQIVKETA